MNKSESKYFNTAIKMDKAFLEILSSKDFEFITVKEICSLAGVNRSTFYLHYETLTDLLNETVEYVTESFLSYIKRTTPEDFISKINVCPIEDLYLITPEYLIGYLNFIKDNKRLYKTLIQNSGVLNLQASFTGLYKYVILPILKRYSVSENDGEYLVHFYISGIMSVISIWLKNDCKDSVEYICKIIQNCIPKK